MKSLATIILLLAITVAFGQQVTVVDAKTQQPLEFVTIYSPSKNVSAITNIKGQADIAQFDGADDILFRIVGYKNKEVNWPELDATGFKVAMQQTQIQLDAVVVSAARWELERSDVPNKITAINPGEIALQNPQTAADLLGSSGGVFIQKSQLGGGSPMIRGFAANRVLIAVDGVRMNNAIFRSGNLQNVINVDPFAIRSTEVIFGPGAVIYGSDAIGGVMNFYTLRPILSSNGKPFIRINALTRYATANEEKTGHLDFNIGLKKWGFATSISFSDYGNLKMGSNGPDDYLRPEYVDRINGVDSVIRNPDPKVQVPTSFNMINLLQKVRFKPNRNWEFSYGFHYSSTSDYSRYDRHIRYRDSLPRSAQWYYGPQTWMMNTLDISGNSPTKIYDRFGITLAHQFFEESRHDRNFRKNILYNRTENVNVFSINVDFDKKLADKMRLFYGAEIQLNKVNSKGTDVNILTNETASAASRYPDGSSLNAYAVYGSYLNKLNEVMTFQGGLRYSISTLNANFDTTFYPFPFTEADLVNSALSGSAGLNYHPNANWQYKINLATGFRAPNIDDVGKVFDSEPGFVIVPNPDLKPEYAYSAEIGITRNISDRLRFDVTLFYTLLDNAMVRRNFQLNGMDSIVYDGEMSRVQAIQNAASANVYGIQAEAEIDFGKGFGIHANFNYQKGEEELDDETKAPLRHASPTFGNVSFNYTGKRLTANFYAIFNGKISYNNLAPSERQKDYIYAHDGNGNPFSPSWHTINLKVMYSLSQNIKLSAGIENITDQRYRPYSSGIAGAGRNFIAAAKFTF
jgi:hemoglobin/transferrin/lactoferrin receptor protein